MNTLYELQKKLAAALNSEKNISLAEICPHSKLTAPQQLAIYRDSTKAALIHVLRNTYAVCTQLVGLEFFNAMAAVYVRQTPSQSPNINDYGKTFPRFIQNFPPLQSLAYLADVAALEWAYHQALHSEDYPPLPIDALAAITEENYPSLIFTLPPTSSLLSSVYPLDRIWEFHQPNYQGKARIDLNEGGVKLFIWRQAMDLRMDPLNQHEWLLLNVLHSGLTVDALCDHPELLAAEINVVSLLTEFVQKGWITGFRLARHHGC